MEFIQFFTYYMHLYTGFYYIYTGYIHWAVFSEIMEYLLVFKAEKIYMGNNQGQMYTQTRTYLWNFIYLQGIF